MQHKKQRVILHIDDDEEDRMILESALKKMDNQIVIRQAESGSAALSLLHESRDSGMLPSLLVLDMNLPGMNGKEVLKEIRKDQELASLPVVIFTTASKETYKNLLKKENVEFLTKPNSPSELLDCVRKILSYCPPE